MGTQSNPLRLFQYFSMAWLVFAFATAVLAVETTNSATTPNCTPSNCVAKCNPSCSSDQVCVLGTMSECGVCPKSSCVSRALLGGGGSSNGGDSSSSGSDSSSGGSDGSSNNNSHSNNKDQGTLIGGVVGGLLGAGLVVSAAGYAGFRYRQKKRNTLPFAFQGKSMSHHLQTDNSSIRDMQQMSSPPPLRQQVMSGVIPVAYVPPSRDSVRTQDQQPRPISQDTRSIEREQQQYDHAVRSSTLYRFKQQQQQIHQQLPHNERLSTSNDNPFSDTMVVDDDDDEDRESVIQPTTATYQVMRARPQIMRVNTVRVQDGLTRQGSTRTILTKEDELDDPFHDRHHTNTNLENNPTDSILSGPGDGEITIFWDGKRSSS